MTTKTKIIIAAGGMLFALIAVVAGVLIYVAFDEEALAPDGGIACSSSSLVLRGLNADRAPQLKRSDRVVIQMPAICLPYLRQFTSHRHLSVQISHGRLLTVDYLLPTYGFTIYYSAPRHYWYQNRVRND